MIDTQKNDNKWGSDVILTEDGFILEQTWWVDPHTNEKLFDLIAYNPYDEIIGDWETTEDLSLLSEEDFKKTNYYKAFQSLKTEEEEREGDYHQLSLFDYGEDDDDDSVEGSWLSNYHRSLNRGYSKDNSSTYHYEPPKKKTGFYDDVTKSDTLVFHKTDNSTTMLDQIYEGKGWDVLHSCYDLDEEELFKVVDAHKRIVCLGHGTPYGLMGMFGPEMAPYFKDKKLFIIWCNADAYFKNHGIGEGQFVTGNMPSEVWECRGAGCGNISSELMLENITYWSKLCADVVERCLSGDVKSSVDYIRKNYLEKYGNHPVTIYNSERTQCLGDPQALPSYKFKGEPLTPENYPVPGFIESLFLKAPTADAKACPTSESEVEYSWNESGESGEMVIVEDLNSIYDTYYKDKLDRKTFDTILKIDPTYKEGKMGKYGKWLLTLYITYHVDVVDEAQEFKDQIKIFDDNKHKHEEADRDIGKIKSLEQLIELNHKYEAVDQKTEFQLRAEGQKGVEVIGSTPNWEVYCPTTYEASKYLRGQNAVWCTGRHNDDHFWKSYSSKAYLIIFINKNNRDDKYQGAFSKTNADCSEFRNAQNGWVDFVSFLVKNDELIPVLQNSKIKKCKDLKEAETYLELKKGKPFVYDGSLTLSDPLKNAIVKIEFKSKELKSSYFSGCGSLEELVIPEGVTVIPTGCFSTCDNLKKVTLPTTITSIESLAFFSCPKLEVVEVPEGVSSLNIGIYAFKGCKNLKIRATRGTIKLLIAKTDIEDLRPKIQWRNE